MEDNTTIKIIANRRDDSNTLLIPKRIFRDPNMTLKKLGTYVKFLYLIQCNGDLNRIYLNDDKEEIEQYIDELELAGHLKLKKKPDGTYYISVNWEM